MNNNLESTVADLLKRLEQATTRLETVEKALASGGNAGGSSAGSAGSSAPSAQSAKEFQNLVDQYIVNLVALSKKIAPELGKQAEELAKAIDAETKVIQTASQSKKPNQDLLMKVIAPINAAAQQVSSIRDSHRSSKVFNNLSALSEGVGFLSWVVVEPTPGPHVSEMRSSAEFYTNRILKEFKGVNQDQVDWVTNYISFLKDLEKYIKQYHTTGLTWNPKGGEATVAAGGASTPSSAPTTTSGGPPLPPPPPPVLDVSEFNKPGKADMSSVMSSIAAGNLTSGLNKVTKDMKTSNMANKSSVVKASDKPTVAKADIPTKPPKFGLEANKWVVEYQVSNKNIIIEAPEAKHTVYIYQCVDSVVQIQGKVNTIILDSCKKTAVVFGNVISSCEVVNCTSVEIQTTGKVPSISIDKTSNIQVYLSKESLDAEIITSKSSDMNVLIPGETANDDMIEIAVPQQFRTVVKGKTLATESVSHI